MPDGMTVEKMKKDTSVDTRHIRSIFTMDKFIKDNPGNGLKYASKYYGDDDHGSVPLISDMMGCVLFLAGTVLSLPVQTLWSQALK
jgi:hypothetical protein